MNINITTLLREIRAKTGWSEPQIALKIGVSQPTINRILNGQSDCKGATLLAIVNLHKSIEDLQDAAQSGLESAPIRALSDSDESESMRDGGIRLPMHTERIK